MDNIHIKNFNHSKFWYGLLMVIVGIIMPSIITVNTFSIPEKLNQAIRNEDVIILMVAGLELIALNSLRAFPHYLGAFFITESIEISDNFPFEKLFKSALICLIIPPVYFIIGYVHHIKYYFGMPAFVLIILLMLLGKNDYNRVSGWKKSTLIMVFLTAFQFVDIMPCMEGLPIGRGETSKEVKLIAHFLQADKTVDIMALVFLLLLLFLGALLFLLIRDENNLRSMNALREANRKMEIEAKFTALKNRTFLEMNSLVHDLKSPLTSAQALVGVVKLNCEMDGRSKDVDYLENVELAIKRMSGMISEILYEDYRSLITTDELLQAVLAQISITEYAPYVTVQNEYPKNMLILSKTRMIRVLINLLENAYEATKHTVPNIQIKVSRFFIEDNAWLGFEVSDNGCGIDMKNCDKIWEVGYSTRDSHGLGLSFVKSVVDSYEGWIDIESVTDRGTTIKVVLKEGGQVNG
ncbi:sensor histidine kinase [Fusibacter ferrireducens]|uniref:histidine kinase n=1 Tax=Fusibacter ferrireducens TaxID=2785058 RepID=A0ABR9ZYV3_9FIRM|nr:HAMP domain-containing sensor histidine kinase [Fusibacter ferrireducens]MBF4695634.1 HAMP domain-containing histidine kinase [Fusibacter ferrireducens]